MKEDKDIKKLTMEEIPAQGALGLLALGDVGVTLWREARKKKMEEMKNNKKKEDEQKKG